MQHTSERKQINVRVEDKVLKAIDRLRRNGPDPIPTISDIVRDAILEKESRDLDRKKAVAK